MLACAIIGLILLAGNCVINFVGHKTTHSYLEDLNNDLTPQENDHA